MKIYFLNLLLSVAFGNEANTTADYASILDELNANEIVVGVDTDSMIKIFDVDGNLVTQFLNSAIQEAGNRELVAKSEVMFEYLGDVYYLLDK